MRWILLVCCQMAVLLTGHASASKTARTPGLTEGTRQLANDQFPWIGSLSLLGQDICSVFIVRHGLAVTAKHCIKNIFGMNDQVSSKYFRSFFELHFGFAQHRISSKVDKIVFDSGENDLAYFFYDPLTTRKAFALDTEIYIGKIKKGLRLMTGGFPKRSLFPKLRRDRIVTRGCRSTGYEASAMDKHLKGKYQDSTCPTWDGDSGGPVFQIKPNGTVLLIGTVTDTFDVLTNGVTPDPAFIYKDNFGSYDSTMFNALSESKDLNEFLPTEIFLQQDQ